MALKLFKASAGTGKTYQLTLAYLQLLLGNKDRCSPTAFKNVLAVTFTNKATEEMKTRILQALASLANDQPSSMADDLQRITDLPREELVRRAKASHTQLLHQYSYFSVSTLDAFFQRVIHAFAVEAGLSFGYTLDLDTETLLEKTARQVLDNTKEDISLRNWLASILDEKVRNEAHWELTGLLMEVGKEVTREAFRSFGQTFADHLSDREFLGPFIGELKQLVRTVEATLRTYGQQGLDIMASAGVTIMDFPYKASSCVAYFRKIAHPSRTEDLDPTARAQAAAEGVQAVWGGKNPSALQMAMQAQLQPILQQAIAYWKDHQQAYFTALTVLAQLPNMGIIADLLKTMRAIQVRDNTLDIGDSTYLLSQLVGDGNAPFVYEKMGTYYDSFLLDEFQDTSLLQWKNIHPLLVEGLAKGCDSLVVGDVKQSIYRWRNSDWRILGEEMEADPALQRQEMDVRNLNVNRRSRSQVVQFVNDTMALLLESMTADLAPQCLTAIQRAYEGFQVQVPPSRFEQEPGYVEAQAFYGDEVVSSTEQAMLATRALLADLQQRGYQPNDIALLVRRKSDGQQLLNFLLDYKREHPEDPYCYDLVSSDSLRLSASPHVQLCVAFLRLAINPDDALTQRLVAQLLETLEEDNQVVTDEPFFAGLRTRPLADAFELIVRRMQWQRTVEALPYLQELHDVLLRFAKREGCGIYAFLAWWDRKGSETLLTSEMKGNAIRILTIHKAKGLEAPVVVIPFCQWPIDSNSGFKKSILWVQTEEPPFNQLQRLPVAYNSSLLRTFFNADYAQEKAQRVMDSLNMLYVALTRAKDEMYVFMNTPSKENSNAISTVMASALHLQKGEIERMTYGQPLSSEAIGEMHPQDDSKQGNEYVLQEYPSQPFTHVLKLAYQEDDFAFSQGDSMRQWGLVLHKALSRMRHLEELPAVLAQLVAEGELAGNPETVQHYAQAIQRVLSRPDVAPWYDGTWQVRNEAALVCSKGQLRPDRVMWKDGQTVVIDYKFGEPRSSHKRQMEAYVATLEQMGFAPVTGHLLYISDN